MLLFYSLIPLLVCIKSEETGCTSHIFLESDNFRPHYAKWINVSTTLRCPVNVFEWSIWYSTRAVYKMTTGCHLEQENMLQLDWFPDVPFITAVFRSYSEKVETICNFTSSDGILKAELPSKTQMTSSDYTFQNTVYYAPGESMPINFYICKKANFTNGTCLIYYTNGRSAGDDTALTNDEGYYRVTGSVISERITKYECFATIRETVHLFTVNSKPDTNECSEARNRGLQLCQSSACIDQSPGYMCADADYADTQTCSVMPDWFCPYTSTYNYMSLSDCHVKKCVQAANLGVQLCDTGVSDCETTNDTYRCRRGVPLLDVCNSMNNAINMSCPQLSRDSPDIEKLGSTLYRLAYNAKSLYDLDPEYLTNLSSKMTDQQIQLELDSQSDLERHQMAKQLLDTFISTVHTSTQPIEADSPMPDPRAPEPIKSVSSITPSTSPTKKINMATSILHIIASIVRKSPHTRQLIDSGQANREGFKFLRLNNAKVSAHFNKSDGAPAGVMILSDSVDSAFDSIVAVIPSAEVKGQTPEESLKPKEEGPPLIVENAEVASDVILVDTLDPDLTYEYTLHMLTARNKSFVCQQLRPSKSDGRGTWSSEDCQTVVVGQQLQCRCTPRQTGTFAIALVYWLGDPNIEIENKWLVETVSYVFTAITVVALILFLIFTRFIVAPHSRYHELISRHQNCIPLVWIGYLIPAVIVGAWFGYAGAVSSNLGLDIQLYSANCFGPSIARWVLVGFITIVVIFNFFVLLIVGVVLLRSYLLTRKSRINKSTHFLVLTQLMLTLGLPYTIIYMQFVDHQAMLFTVPIALGTTAVLMFLLVAVIDEENRHRLESFLRAHFTRTTSIPGNHTTTAGQVNPRGSAPKTDSQHTRKRLGSKQWSYREKNYAAGGNGEAAQNLKSNKYAHSETTNSDLKFEPGWLHRFPATAQLPESDSVVVSEDSLNTVAFNRMAQTTAPRTSGESYRSGTHTSPVTSETNIDDARFSPDTINSRGPLTFNGNNGVINGQTMRRL
ncbi:hypothetical protein CSKR_113393 [Clonorchis sinensis]|uniref:G-protein coupled receptors family 2 profile 2 domain-containing protein n=1 Tax=Clonorchis sinensis TaxID=79923 RepID=A0A8T1M1L5_CLOSI|nr:hypothetical protein CSKR_113393 [Clonorchis sinensis]